MDCEANESWMLSLGFFLEDPFLEDTPEQRAGTRARGPPEDPELGSGDLQGRRFSPLERGCRLDGKVARSRRRAYVQTGAASAHNEATLRKGTPASSPTPLAGPRFPSLGCLRQTLSKEEGEGDSRRAFSFLIFLLAASAHERKREPTIEGCGPDCTHRFRFVTIAIERRPSPNT